MYIKTSNQEKLNLGVGNYSCNWGMHIAGLYETEEERDEILFGYLSQGYWDGDIRYYVHEEQSLDNFKEKYSCHCPYCRKDIQNSNNFIISNSQDLYYPDGTFSPYAMDKGLQEFYDESQQNGKINIRATAEMVWALDAIPGVENLMVYESRLNYFIPGKPWISICLYNTNKFSGSIIMQVLQTHPYLLNGGILIQNPYFIDPTEWLKTYAPQFLD